MCVRVRVGWLAIRKCGCRQRHKLDRRKNQNLYFIFFNSLTKAMFHLLFAPIALALRVLVAFCVLALELVHLLLELARYLCKTLCCRCCSRASAKDTSTFTR